MLTIALTDLPNEVIFQILLHLPPSSVPTLQQVSRRFNNVSQPLIWRYHCRTQFKYWSQDHHMEEKFDGNISKVDWKEVFVERHTLDRSASSNIDSILSSQTGRILKSESIVEHGYDSKDSLLRHLHVDEGAEDVLARRYHSNALLGCLHRTTAIQEWAKLKDGQNVALERALAAYDMFVLRDRDGDFDDVSARLDRIANHIRVSHPDLVDQAPRQQAIAIAKYMRESNLMGVGSDNHYHDLQNNFIGIALHDEEHPSLPLISVAIYCCVARRLGLDAQPCGFPFHVLAIIKPSQGYSLDGRALDVNSVSQPMYMDPFRSDLETPIDHLRAQLVSMGVSASSHAALLDVSSTAAMVTRTALNIITSVQTMPRTRGASLPIMIDFPEMDSAFYGALWALLLLPAGNPGTVSVQRARYLPFLVDHLEKRFATDVRLIEEYIIPLVQDPDQFEQLHGTMIALRAADTMPKPVKARTKDTLENIRYRVGQVFRHKRYHYQAVITGWDAKCEAGEDWMSNMGIHELTRGQNQSFYHALVEDHSVRYVAEENIEIIQPDIAYNLMNLAGQHFKRLNRLTHTFVSNIRDEYPND